MRLKAIWSNSSCDNPARKSCLQNSRSSFFTTNLWPMQPGYPCPIAMLGPASRTRHRWVTSGAASATRSKRVPRLSSRSASAYGLARWAEPPRVTSHDERIFTARARRRVALFLHDNSALPRMQAVHQSKRARGACFSRERVSLSALAFLVETAGLPCWISCS